MSFLQGLTSNAQNIFGTAGTLIDKFREDEGIESFAEKLKLYPFLKAIHSVDIVSVQAAVAKIQQEHPDWTCDQVVERLIQSKAVLLGAKGLATSVVPGLAAGMFAVDLASSIAMQAELIYQIAYAYDLDLHDSARKAEALTLFGLGFGGSAALKLGMGFARNIPMAGAVIGAGGNAVMTYALGTSAHQYFKAISSGKTNDEAVAVSQETSSQFLDQAAEQEHALDEVFAHMILAGQPELSLQQLEQNIDQLSLEETSKQNIKTHIHSLRPFNELLSDLRPEYGLVVLAQAERLARSDAHINEQEQALMDQLEQHFQIQAQLLDELITGNYILTEDFKHTVRGLQFSHDGLYLCACSDDRSLKIWKTYDGCRSFQLIHNIQDAQKDKIKALAISPDDKVLVTGSKDRSLGFWDYRNGKLLQRIESGHKKKLNTLAFHGAETLASGSEDGEIKLWNTANGSLRRSLIGHKNSILSLAFHPSHDMAILASGANDKTAKLWNTKNGETIREFKGHRHGVYAIAFSPDSRTLATGSYDQTICLWDIESGEKVATLEGHQAAVWQLIYTPDGQHLISSADDKAIVVWDLSNQQIRLRLDGHQNGIYSLALAPHSSILASGSWDRSVRIWNIDFSD